jgi:hypothetical protein
MFENVNVLAGGVKLQNVVAASAQFTNTSGSAITLSNGTFTSCVTRTNAANVVLGAVTQGAGCP